jgi:hypothetical protein
MVLKVLENRLQGGMFELKKEQVTELRDGELLQGFGRETVGVGGKVQSTYR